MTAGRPRKPIELITGHLSKEDLKNRTQAESEYTEVSRMRLVPPDELTDRAKEMFNQIVSDAFWLDELSVHLLTAYCVCADRMLTCTADLQNEPDVLVTETGFIKNPKTRLLIDYGNTLAVLSAKLGLGNIDRLKIAKPKQKKAENRFEKFLGVV